MNIVKVSILVFLLSFLFVGSVYDYGMYQKNLKDEYSIFESEREVQITTYALEHDECVKEWKSNHTGEPTDYWLWMPMTVRYTINNVDVVGRVMDDEYGCSIWKIPTVSFEEWKESAKKSYWTDLTKRLRVIAVSADECNNFSLYEVGDEYRGYTDTYMPYLSSYMEFCKFFTQTENIRMLVLDDSYRREYTDVNESQIIGRQFNAGRGVSAVYHTEYGAMLKVSRCGCNNEYKYIQPVFVVHHEDYLEFYKILESVYNISTQIKEPPQDIPTVLEVNITTPDAPILNPCDAYINNSNWKCEYNESTGHIWITAVGWCNNCEGEGCEPEELPEPPKITELGDEWEDVNESIFEMYPIHNSPTIYTMDYPKERKYFNPWWVSQ
jgi:hypothetical protein